MSEWKFQFRTVHAHRRRFIFTLFFLFAEGLWECVHLCRHPLHLLSTLAIMETKPVSVKKSTEYSPFFVIKFALTSKPAAHVWQNMLLREPQKSLNVQRESRGGNVRGLQKTLRFEEASAASHCLDCFLFVLKVLDMRDTFAYL